MTNPIDAPNRMDIGGGASIEADGSTVELAGVAVSVLALRLPVARAHRLAHSLVGDPAPDLVLSDRTIARGVEAVAALAGELGALRCAAHLGAAVVDQRQRVNAAGVLRDREPRLSPVQRIAVIDAAARWMEEDAGDELARALLASVCSTEVVTNEVYVALLLPGGDER